MSFQRLVHTLFAFCYRFWMKAMPKLKSRAKTQYLHRKSAAYRCKVYEKVEAYEGCVQVGAIALGSLQLVSLSCPALVWKHFPLWLRTPPKSGCPSEGVVRLTLQHDMRQIFMRSSESTLLSKFLATRRRQPEEPHPMQMAA